MAIIKNKGRRVDFIQVLDTSYFVFIIYLLYYCFVQIKCKPHWIIVQLQMVQEIALFWKTILSVLLE